MLKGLQMVQQVQASLCLPDDTEKKNKISFNNKCTTTALKSMNTTKMSGSMYHQGIYNRNTNCKMRLHQPSAPEAPPKSEGFHQVQSLSLARLSHPEGGQNRHHYNHDEQLNGSEWIMQTLQKRYLHSDTSGSGVSSVTLWTHRTL